MKYKMKLEIELTEEWFNQIRADNCLAEDMSDEDIQSHVSDFFSQMESKEGLSLLMENLDFFNY